MNRLPGPEDDERRPRRSRRRRPPEAATSGGVSQTSSTPAVAAMRDWPSMTLPSRSRAWRVSGVGETGSTWPRTASTRLTCANAFLEVAALDRGHRGDEQVADRMAGQRVGRRVAGMRSRPTGSGTGAAAS